MKYQAIKTYSDAQENPILVEKGEILTFVEESNPNGPWANWVFCKGMVEEKEGWVPKQILQIEGEQVSVLEDYIAREHNLAVGDVLLTSHSLNGWIWGVKENKPEVFAWAPLNYLELL